MFLNPLYRETLINIRFCQRYMNIVQIYKFLVRLSARFWLFIRNNSKNTSYYIYKVSAICNLRINKNLVEGHVQINSTCTRGIWKVLSMVFLLSNRYIHPIMFGIILKSYLSSMLWQNFHEDIIMLTRKIIIWIHVLFVYWITQNFSGKFNILPFEKCAEH